MGNQFSVFGNVEDILITLNPSDDMRSQSVLKVEKCFIEIHFSFQVSPLLLLVKWI
jgi:hypothetical protein